MGGGGFYGVKRYTFCIVDVNKVDLHDLIDFSFFHL